MLAFLSCVFVMADIEKMYKTALNDVWIAARMTGGKTPPRIAAFADTHDPALLYAELLRKYTSGELKTGLDTAGLYPRYQDQKTSGYFCQHDGFVSFVPGTKDLINDQNQLKQTLDSFRKKYQETNWTLPTFPISLTAQQEIDLQTVATNDSKTPLESVLRKAAEFGHHIELDHAKCPILYHGTLSAAPHIHPYNTSMTSNKAFKLDNTFIVFDHLFDIDQPDANPIVLFRPHAYLLRVDGTTPADYQESFASKEKAKSWKAIFSTITWADGSSKKFENDDFSVHEGTQATVASEQLPEVGTLIDLLKKGPFFSEITNPEEYRIKTLHILLNGMPGEVQIPLTAEKLLTYLSQLPLEQQKFIIRQLFPFSTV
jgi:hypothetical protein